MKPRSAASRRHLSSSPFNVHSAAPPVETFAVGDRVTHDKHGLGRVTDVQGEAAVVVQFGSEQVRVTAPFSKLTKL
jgi:hypothetical protein